jgi:hypothetical protein
MKNLKLLVEKKYQQIKQTTIDLESLSTRREDHKIIQNKRPPHYLLAIILQFSTTIYIVNNEHDPHIINN